MLRQLLQTISAESRTVIMTTHNLERAVELCDRLAILARGRIVYEAQNASLSLADLQQAYWQYVENRSTREQAQI